MHVLVQHGARVDEHCSMYQVPVRGAFGVDRQNITRLDGEGGDVNDGAEMVMHSLARFGTCSVSYRHLTGPQASLWKCGKGRRD